MNIAKTRKIYETQCHEYKTSPYRELRKYAGYLEQFLYSKDNVDGMAFKDRADKLPMSYTRYFQG